ncbi:ATP-binding protein [Nocardioides sp.]|uniref:sensor histidine kinase n=1 Tax=Nocardioides sp. TaxID=35761 RepID=UPI00286DB56C|nr:ATP-binding protein [Nocardioides sp.]
MNGDQIEIVLVSAASALSVGVLGLAAAWLLRNRSLRWQLIVIAVVSVLSVLGGILAIAQRMLISPHDLDVVTTVTVVGAAISLLVALALASAVSRWSRTLRDDVRRVGSAGAAIAERRGPAELQALSAELAATHRRLAEADERESRLEAARRELVAWVSHDLRTPLAGIRAMTEALEDGIAVDPNRYHRQIRAEVDRMVRMVDDLFELSRINAGVLSLAPVPLLLVDLVSEALAGAGAIATARRVRLDGDVPHGLEVHADPAALARVLANLIANGIRHTPADGTVHIAARAVPGGVEIGVTDGCGGIPDDERERVFDVAFRGTEARSPAAPDEVDTGGARAGLGLAIVKGIVEAHDGAVTVANVREPASGCRFLIRLPA